MVLRFTRWRTLPPKDELLGPAESKRQAQPSQTLLGLGGLTEVDRRQLVACAGRGSKLRFTVEELFADDFSKKRGDASWIGESTEVAFEWWDVVDERGEAQFQTWFYHADGALVFRAGTSSVVFQGIQFGSAWELEGDPSKELQQAFATAQRAAIAAYPKSDLAQHYVFEP